MAFHPTLLLNENSSWATSERTDCRIIGLASEDASAIPDSRQEHMKNLKSRINAHHYRFVPDVMAKVITGIYSETKNKIIF